MTLTLTLKNVDQDVNLLYLESRGQLVKHLSVKHFFKGFILKGSN